MEQNDSRMLTISEVANILHVHPNTLRNWCDKRLIKAYHIGPRGDRRFRKEDVENFIAQSKKENQNLNGITETDVDSSDQFKAIFENASGEMYCIDKSGRIIATNIQSESIVGYTREEIVGKRFTDFTFTISYEQMLNMAEQFGRVTEGSEGPKFVELDIMHKDGRVFSIQASARVFHKDGVTEGVIISLRDITEQKQAEDILKKSEDNFRILFNSTVDGLAVVDARSRRFLLVNEKMAKMSGYGSVDDLIGMSVFDIMKMEDRDLAIDLSAEDLFEHNVGDTYEFRGITQGGEERWIEVVGTMIHYQGKSAGLMSVRDITERKMAEEEGGLPLP